MALYSSRDQEMTQKTQKQRGGYYTPEQVVATLLRWAIRRDTDRLLDPACGDGRFIAGHRRSVGVETDAAAAQVAVVRAPWALVHEGDFFTWAGNTNERFECAAGNPPFIRYQNFNGDTRSRALALCAQLGADFTGLTSSWAPFLVAAAGLLNPGGRLAFVVPAEIGHAPYSAPLLRYLVGHFSVVHLVAIKEKLFPDLSEDCWLLYAEDYGGKANTIRLTAVRQFATSQDPPENFVSVSINELQSKWNGRLRPFLMSQAARELYLTASRMSGVVRLSEVASVGIGYVTGANEFFHLRRSQAERWSIPNRLLRQTVRRGEVLPRERLTRATVEAWERNDEPILLLALPRSGTLPKPVMNYLETEDAKTAKLTYKCRNRTPWYSVPDVNTPDFFLSYMSGLQPNLVRNEAECTGTNSVHMVRLRRRQDARFLETAWRSSLVRLSCELEGHPLGGGMLKLEPREAGRILLPPVDMPAYDEAIVTEALATMRSWRHIAG